MRVIEASTALTLLTTLYPAPQWKLSTGRRFAFFLFALGAFACESSTKEELVPTSESPKKHRSPKPTQLYLPPEETSRHSFDVRGTDEAGSQGVSFGPRGGMPLTALPSGKRCPADMVAIDHEYCVDRYEASLVDSKSGRSLSPHYPPSKEYTTSIYERWVKRAPASGRRMGRELQVPRPPAFQFTDDFHPQARSLPGSLPAGYLTRGFAESACKNAGKRLCSRHEWVRACQGQEVTKFPYGAEYKHGTCNVHRESHPARLLHGDASHNHKDPRLGLSFDDDGPLLRTGGAMSECVSRWGDDAIYDMVGNIDEWIDDPGGAFLGGFFSRATRSGCNASIDSHSPAYLDYSLGTRCCQNQ